MQSSSGTSVRFPQGCLAITYTMKNLLAADLEGNAGVETGNVNRWEKEIGNKEVKPSGIIHLIRINIMMVLSCRWICRCILFLL